MIKKIEIKEIKVENSPSNSNLTSVNQTPVPTPPMNVRMTFAPPPPYPG